MSLDMCLIEFYEECEESGMTQEEIVVKLESLGEYLDYLAELESKDYDDV
jgi:hypothetical protein